MPGSVTIVDASDIGWLSSDPGTIVDAMENDSDVAEYEGPAWYH